MKICYYVQDLHPSRGGGYTFQNEIHKLLLTAQTSHEFDFITNTKELKAGVHLLWYLSQHWDLIEDIPYVYTVWDLQHRLQPFFPEVSINGQWQYRENFNSIAIQRAAYVVTGTERGKEEVSFFYRIPESRIKVFPMPVPKFTEKETSNIQEQQFFLKENNIFGPYVFFPAQFWPHKNHIVVLEAMKILRERLGLRISAVFTGSDQGNLNYIKNCCKIMGIKDSVKFLGFVSRKELHVLYKNAVSLVFPSFFGPDNLPPIEAFSLGCPVIAAKVFGAEEQLKDAALFFEPANSVQLAQCIYEILNNNVRKKELIAKGFCRAQEIGFGINYLGNMLSLIEEFSMYRRNWFF